MIPVSGSDVRLEQFFLENVRTIVAINQARGIKIVFIGQMLNKEILESRPQLANGISPLIRNGEVWPLQARFNSILKDVSTSIGANYIDAGIENFKNDDFADVGHFSPAGSKKFAALIATEVEKYCQ
jgi:hypothetical protein